MYLGFSKDRIELGFEANNDLSEIKISLRFKKIFRNSTSWIIIKGQKIFILIFSKEFLIGFVLFFRSQSISNNSNLLSASSSQPFQSSITKCNKSESLLNPLPRSIFNTIVPLRGGADSFSEFDNLTIEEQCRLLNSVLSKAHEEFSDYERTSLGKILKNIYQFIDRDEGFWRIVKELISPLEPNVITPNYLKSNEILGSSRNPQVAKTKNSKPSSSLFVEGLPLAQQYRRNYNIQGRVRLNLFDENVQNPKKVEKLTKLRRELPHLPSKSLGKNFYSGLEQLKKKSPSHLKADYDFPIGNLTAIEQALKYYELIEQDLASGIAKNKLENRTSIMNDQEKITGFLNTETNRFTAFEDKPDYDNQAFITSYRMNDPGAIGKFLDEDNSKVGLSKAEKKMLQKKYQEKLATKQKIKNLKHEFYSQLPEDARVTNQQILEVKNTKSDLQLTDKQKALKERVDRYNSHKEEFCKKHPDFNPNQL